MATYLELNTLAVDSNLINKLAVAVTVKAAAMLDKASPTAGEVAWATNTLKSPVAAANLALRYVLAKTRAPALRRSTLRPTRRYKVW